MLGQLEGKALDIVVDAMEIKEFSIGDNVIN
jgi:hypothetical protein